MPMTRSSFLFVDSAFSWRENVEIGREGMKAPLLRRQSIGDAGGCRMKAHRLW